ncbi:MAG: HU family DNA-binding protein [SAR324 cluster bacterium]|nr:HU family DNA-binding protein [SAR324 cluster bacterium]
MSNVTKSDLIDQIAEQTNITKAAAGKALEAVTGGISSALTEGKSVTLVGFGTFSVADRAARDGRNPKTGEPIKIPAAKVAKFKVGKALKEAVNS